MWIFSRKKKVVYYKISEDKKKKDWVGPQVCSGFSVTSNGKMERVFWLTHYFIILWPLRNKIKDKTGLWKLLPLGTWDVARCVWSESEQSLPVLSRTWSSSQGYMSVSSGGTVGFGAGFSLRPAFLFTKLT